MCMVWFSAYYIYNTLTYCVLAQEFGPGLTFNSHTAITESPKENRGYLRP